MYDDHHYARIAVERGYIEHTAMTAISHDHWRIVAGGRSLGLRAYLLERGLVTPAQDAEILSQLARGSAAQEAPGRLTEQPRDGAGAHTDDAAVPGVTRKPPADDPRVVAATVSADAVAATIGVTRVADPRTLDAPVTPDGFERFRLGDEIGRGGFGRVCVAEDVTLRRDVAMKILLDRENKNAHVKFLDEAQITGQLEHPNIVPVHELGRHPDGRPYMVMKLVRGEDLSEVIDKALKRARRSDVAATREERRLLEVVLKVCDAVAYAHNRGVVHRDLKPENVMVGEFGEVLLMDWGLAKPFDVGEGPMRRRGSAGRGPGGSRSSAAVRGVSSSSSAPASAVPPTRGHSGGRQIMTDARKAGGLLTIEGQVSGTPQYMAPEQATGEAELIGPRTDIYALGGVLYQVITGVAPFPDGQVDDVLQDVADGRLIPPSRRVTQRRVPRELEAVVLKAMARDPLDRYSTVAEFRTDIENYLDGRALSAADYSALQRLGKWATRNKRAVGAAGIGALLLVGLSIGAVVWQVESARENEQARIAEQAEIARGVFADAKSTWITAEARTPFNATAPQAYFQERLTALMDMSRALKSHPDAPDEWRQEIAMRAWTLQSRAQDVGNWALAAVLAKSVEAWGAGDAQLRDERLAEIEVAKDAAADADRRRLRAVLERIAEAESDGGQGLIPGELEERARMVARGGGEALIQEAAALIDDPAAAPVDSRARQFLINVLGRTANTQVRIGEDGAPVAGRIRDALFQPRGAVPEDEIAQWLWAGAQLVAREPSAFNSLSARSQGIKQPPGSRTDSTATGDANDDDGAGRPSTWGFDSIVREVRATYAEGLIVQTTAIQIGQFLELIHGEQALPSPIDAPIDYRLQVAQLADWAAAAVESRDGYTRLLLEYLEHPDWLTTNQAVFLLDQLGLHGDTTTRRDHAGAFDAVEVLRAQLANVPIDWLTYQQPRGVAAEPWNRARDLAVSAVTNLVRLDAPGLAQELLVRRHNAGRFSRFWYDTEVAALMVSLDHWPTPESAHEFEQRGRAQFDHRNFRQARADFEAALRIGEALAPVHAGLALCARFEGEYQAALDHYNAALQIERSAALYNDRSRVLDVLGDRQGALDDLNAALALEPENPYVLTNRANWYRAVGNPAQALIDYTRAIEANPEAAGAFFGRGQIEASQGRFLAALADYDETIRLDPLFVGGYLERGNLALAQRDVFKAIADYNVAIGLSPRFITAYIQRARAHMLHQNDAAALTDLTRAIEIDPKDRLGWYWRGMLHLDRRRLDDAQADFREALKRVPRGSISWEEVMLKIGTAHAFALQYDDAIRVLDELIDHRDDARFYLVRATVKQYQRRYTEAIRDLSAAQQLEPNNWEIFNQTGLLLAELRRVREAHAAFDRASALAPPHMRDTVEANRRDVLGVDGLRPEANPRGLPPLPSELETDGRYGGVLEQTDETLDGGYADRASFVGQAGQRVRIAVRSDEFNPVLVLTTPGGARLEFDDAANGNFDSLAELTLPERGVYTIAITSRTDGAIGDYVVEYELK